MTLDEVKSLVRPNILSLEPYACARDEFKGEADLFLDANENSLGSVVAPSFNRYPDPLAAAVKEKVARIKGVRPEQIFLGNGSDEAIDLLFRLFCRPGEDAAVVQPPTYGMYAVSAAINDVRVLKVPLSRDFQPDPSALLAAAGAVVKLLFFCSPNNPSANLMAAERVQAVLDGFPGMVVIDEAYIDFCPEASWLGALARHPNLVILQTFSKAWGMAGLRLGMLFAHPFIIGLLNHTKPPYNVDAYTQRYALEALEHEGRKNEMAALLKTEREMLAAALAQLPDVIRVFPSDANFLLVRFRAARKTFAALMRHGIIVRDRSSQLHCEECLRITVGAPEENRVLVETLRSLGAA
ncbi:MAG TPA: histidinol-phosphate transaminase [bacterium]|nr:histidinol-phosphate transaminase [bacterium]HQG44946.1 histidinol-phosphate transaminase [bacterium]HQJ64163.1 histidinol-phosphate transaminase [bacterium]